VCDKRFTFAYIFAAEPGSDSAFALVLPDADTGAMQQFLVPDHGGETLASAV
jgi:hypothetical protein